MLEENDGAGNTFKATAKPVLIGTAVVGATTMIFSIIMALTNGLTTNVDKLSLLHAPFVLGLITGGAMIYWFTGASTQAVTTGAYRAVEFIKANIKLEGIEKASVADSKKVVAICTQYAQKGMLNIFIAVFFAALSFAFVEPFFFIGYLISIAIFGLYQAIFMANAGGAWDNAKKIVEVELKQKGTPLHDATVMGDTVGDPFKDTSSVALNPVIKFTTLFGLLAVELAVDLSGKQPQLTQILAAVFFIVSFFFVYRSFYGMRIKAGEQQRGADPGTRGGHVRIGADKWAERPHPLSTGVRYRMSYDLIRPRNWRGSLAKPGNTAFRLAVAEVLGHNFAEDAAVIGGDGEVAALVKLAIAQSRPARVNFPAFNVAAHHEHAIGVAVIGAAIAVFVRGASEFGHADEHDVAHAVAHVLVKRGNSLPQIAQQIREAALTPPSLT